MPVIYSPKLSEVYRTTFYTVPSSLSGWVSSGEALVTDGQGATTWEQITGVIVPIQTVSVLNSVCTNQLNTDFISIGTILVNNIETTAISTNILSTGSIYTNSLTTESLSSINTNSDTVTINEMVGNSLQTTNLSTGLLLTNKLNLNILNTSNLSSGTIESSYVNTSTVISSNISSSSVKAWDGIFITFNGQLTSFNSTFANNISSGNILAYTLSTKELFVSSINGISYDKIKDLGNDIICSTIIIKTTMTATSSINTNISTSVAQIQSGNIDQIDTNNVYGRTTTAIVGHIHNQSTNYISSGLISTISYNTKNTYANELSSIIINSKNTEISSLDANVIACASVITNKLVTNNTIINTLSSSAFKVMNANMKFISANYLSSGQAFANTNFTSTVNANYISSGYLNSDNIQLDTGVVRNIMNSDNLNTNNISATTIFTNIASSIVVYASTINGIEFPSLFEVNPDLVLSTILVNDWSSSLSTLVQVVSTQIFDGYYVKSDSAFTNTLIVDQIDALTASFSTGILNTVYTKYNLIQEGKITYLNTRNAYTSTLIAEEVVLDSFYINNATAISTSALDITVQSSFVNIVSSGTIIGGQAYIEYQSTVQLGASTITASTIISDKIFADRVSANKIYINEATISTLNTENLNIDNIYVKSTILDTLSVNTISSGIFTTDKLNSSNINLTHISEITANINYGTFNTVLFATLFSTPLLRIHPLLIEASNISANTISTASLTVHSGNISSLNSIIISTNQIEAGIANISSINTNTFVQKSTLVNSGYINKMYTNILNTEKFGFEGAIVNSMSTNFIDSSTNNIEIQNTNRFDVTLLSSGTVNINSILTGNASTNVISTIELEGGSADFYILKNEQINSINANISTISTGLLTAYAISTYSMTVWGPNTLLVQGSTIFDGPVINQDGPMFISSIQLESLNINSISSISTIQFETAVFDTLATNNMIGSTLSTSKLVTNGTLYATFMDISTIIGSTLIAEQISTFETRVTQLNASTITVNAFATVSTVYEINTLTADSLNAEYMDINESLSTSKIYNNFLSFASISAYSISTHKLSTSLISIKNLNVDNDYSKTISSGIISTSHTNNISIYTDIVSTGNLYSKIIYANTLSTNILSTTILDGNIGIFNSLSTPHISTGTLSAYNANIGALSTNILNISNVYADTINVSSIGADSISSGTATVSKYLRSKILTVNNISTGGLNVQNAIIDSLSTNIISTGQGIGSDGIFQGDSISTGTFSTSQLKANFVTLSSIIMNTLSAGTIIITKINANDVSTNITNMSSMNHTLDIRAFQISTNLLSTILIFGKDMQSFLTNTNTNNINANILVANYANGNIISNSHLTFTGQFTANEGIFGSTFIQRISVGSSALLSTISFINISTNSLLTDSANVLNGRIISTSANIISNDRVIIGQDLLASTFSSAITYVNILNMSTSTYGNIQGSTINGTNLKLNLSNNIMLSSITVTESTQTVSLSTFFISTTNINNSLTTSLNFPLMETWLMGLSTTGINSAQRIRYMNNAGTTTTTWQNANTSNLGSCNLTYGFGYNGEYFLACRSGANTPLSSIMRSYDGINWTGIQSGGFGNFAYNAVWNGRMWVASGQSNTNTNLAQLNPVENLQYSYDGLNWSNSVTVPTSLVNIRALGWNGNMWVCGGGVASNTTSISTSMAYSYDGSNWSRGLSANTNQGRGADGRFSAGTNGAYTLSWNGNLWIAVGTPQGGLSSNLAPLQYSRDGIRWFFSATTPITDASAMFSVDWNGNFFLAVGSNTAILRSTDGSNWTSNASVSPSVKPDIVWNGNYWLLTLGTSGTNSVSRSTDGSTWISVGSSDQSAIPTGLLYSDEWQSSFQLRVGNLEFYGQDRTPTYLDKVHQIYTNFSTLHINRTGIIARNTNQFMINTNLYLRSTAKLIVDGVIYCSGEAYKPSSDTWTVLSDRKMKTNIQPADYQLCYNTMKNLSLYRYTYTEAFKQLTPVGDNHVLGFIAQDVSNYFPKAVTKHSMYGYDDLLILDQSQLSLMHYGATKHLISMNNRHASYISSLYYSSFTNIASYTNALLDDYSIIEQQYECISTNMDNVIVEYESTIASNFITISTLNSRYETISSLISII